MQTAENVICINPKPLGHGRAYEDFKSVGTPKVHEWGIFMSVLFSKIYQSLQRGSDVVIATIMSKSGSTPRSSGSKMLIYDDGSIDGTIGGGVVEADVIRTALELFTTRDSVLKSYDFKNSTNTDQMDLICGGWMQILIEYVSIDEDNVNIFRMVNNSLQRANPAVLIGKLRSNKKNGAIDRSVKVADSDWSGPLRVTPELHKILEKYTFDHNTASLLLFEDQQYVIESLLPAKTIYLVGAGHVSREIARILNHIDFQIIVIDDRIEFANQERFPEADEVIVCPDYSGVFKESDIDTESYIIIVTRGHRFDKEVLAQALRTKAGYIGMIGSRKKRDTIYQALLAESFNSHDLDRVHCPIGLAIDAETPSEIAVSIVAQLIQYRALRRSNG
ncbi:MAG: XdhC family protein [Deltaproteobacteria bacterium]|nr:XdhC family protein [Deltaproteobacteria bacterium]